MTESHTLTDEDLRAMLAEVLHEHLAVRWVETHESILQREWGRWHWKGYPADYQRAPASWALLVYLEEATGLRTGSQDDVGWKTWQMPLSHTLVEITYMTHGPFPALSWMKSLRQRTTREWLADFHVRHAQVRISEDK